LQTEESLCKNQFYKYLSYENYEKDNPDDYKKYYNGRISGTVCGLDPYHCGNKQNWENNQGQPNLIEFKPPNCKAINCSMDDEECREKRIACSHSRENIRWKDDITKWPVCTAKNITKLTEVPTIPIESIEDQLGPIETIESMTCKIIENVSEYLMYLILFRLSGLLIHIYLHSYPGLYRDVTLVSFLLLFVGGGD